MYIEALEMDSAEILNIFKGLGCQADEFWVQSNSDGVFTMQLKSGYDTEFEYPLYESKTWLADAVKAFKKIQIKRLEIEIKLAQMKLDFFKRQFKTEENQ